jgi:uncharacterized membrane protein (DUF485 family)
MSDAETGPRGTDDYYREVSAARRRFILPTTSFVLIFYFLLPLLGNFSAILDGIAFSGLSWAYVYAFAQFAMVLVVTTIYRRQMDELEARLLPSVRSGSPDPPGSAGTTGAV